MEFSQLNSLYDLIKRFCDYAKKKNLHNHEKKINRERSSSGKRIKRLRHELRYVLPDTSTEISARKLAEMIGLNDLELIERCENGIESPSKNIIDSLTSKTAVSKDFLLDGSVPPWGHITKHLNNPLDIIPYLSDDIFSIVAVTTKSSDADVVLIILYKDNKVVAFNISGMLHFGSVVGASGKGRQYSLYLLRCALNRLCVSGVDREILRKKMAKHNLNQYKFIIDGIMCEDHEIDDLISGEIHPKTFMENRSRSSWFVDFGDLAKVMNGAQHYEEWHGKQFTIVQQNVLDELKDISS